MATERLVECAFLIPIRRDKNLSDGKPHRPGLWDRLRDELQERFGGWTLAPGLYTGGYIDPDTGEPVTDRSRKYTVALARHRIDDLRQLLAQVCKDFKQKCIYLSVAGSVEFIEAI